MRRLLALAALCVLLSGLPAAQAQPGPAAESVAIEDPAGDTQSSAPAGFVDLRRATVSWNETALSAAFELEGPMDPSPATYPFFADYWLEFAFGGERFRLAGMYANNPLSGIDSQGVFLRPPQLWRQADGGWARVEAPTAWPSPLSWSVQWSGIRTASEAFPNPGQTVELLSAGSHWDEDSSSVHESGPGKSSASDDATFPAGALVRVPGSLSPIVASTPHPVRFSNGEATTFHWPVDVHNGLASGVDLAVRAEAPANLVPSVPGAIHLAAGETKPVQVYVTVPFAHDHGSDVTIRLVLEGGGETVQYPLQIHYPEVPQPAGHHPTLFLHGRVSNEGAGTTQGGQGWMNALEDDPDSTASLLSGTPATCPGDSVASEAWWLPLKPALRIGLDADPARQGLLKGTFEETRVRAAGTLHASLELHDAATMGDWNSAPFQPDAWTTSVDIPAATGAGTTPFEMPILIRPELDRVEPTTQQNLALRLVYCVAGSDAAGTSGALSIGGIRAGAFLQLPLYEFHDVLAIEGSQLVQMSVGTPGVRAAPGSTVPWEVRVTVPPGHRARTYAIGSAVGLVDFQGPDEVAGEATLGVALKVPSDARAGDLLEFIVVAEGTTDAAVSGGIRLSVTVDPDAPLVQGAASEGKESPLGPAAFAGLALALALAGRRARR